MAFGLSSKRYSPIGVDFGVDSIKLLQIVPTDPPQFVAAGAVSVPEAVRNDPAARYAFVADALRDLTRTQPFKGRKVICSIPAWQMILHQFDLVRADGVDLDQQVGEELRERLNIEPLRMVVRGFPVHEAVREGASRQEVIALAIGRDAVMRYIDAARRAKLDVIGMHAEPVAVLRAFGHLYRRADDAQRTTCFIDIGAATTKVVIAHGQTMVFARTIHAGGDQITQELARDRKVSFDEARLLRIRAVAAGRAGGASPTSDASEDVPLMATSRLRGVGAALAAEPSVATGVRPVTTAPTAEDAIQCIIDELQLCVRYHQSLFPNRRIEKLVFVGGEAHHVKHCQTIARALRIGAQLGDPLARMVRLGQVVEPTGVDLRQPQPGWAVPLGLCLSEANL